MHPGKGPNRALKLEPRAARLCSLPRVRQTDLRCDSFDDRWSGKPIASIGRNGFCDPCQTVGQPALKPVGAALKGVTH